MSITVKSVVIGINKVGFVAVFVCICGGTDVIYANLHHQCQGLIKAL